MSVIVIFGGTGFVGIHYARKILSTGSAEKIILADIKDIQPQFLFSDIRGALTKGLIAFVKCDVRDIGSFESLPTKDVSRICNFAAVHREPGHEHHEYYDTNIPGAENVCTYAEGVGCKTVVFTSSIAVYEPTELPKSERTVPAPISAYGGSKLASEWIHRAWQARDPDVRRLVIVRPGVVYGPSEGGNVTRMIKMIAKGLFVYVGNRQTRKASIYVKELIGIIDRVLESSPGVALANAVVPMPPSMEDYVNAVNAATGWNRRVLSLPYGLVYFASFFVVALMPPIARKTGINPVRVKKLRRVNNIVSDTLQRLGSTYQYTLESAFADWYADCPADWSH